MRSLCKGLPVRRKVLSLAGLHWPRLSEQANDDLRGAVPELAGTSARQLSSFLQHLPPFLSPIASSSSIHAPSPHTQDMSTRKRKQDAEEEEELQALPSEGSDEEEEE